MFDLSLLSYESLFALGDLIDKEIDKREQEEPFCYICCECGFVHKYRSSVEEHLEIIHGYPDEDARLGTKEVRL